MKKISKNQRDARKHNTEESGESFRNALRNIKKPEPKAVKRVKKVAKALREGDPTQDRPSKLKD